MRTPLLVLTSEQWAPSPAVMFEDESVWDVLPCGSDFLITEHELAVAKAAAAGTPAPSLETVALKCEEEFWRDNTRVNESWETEGILETVDGEFYKYDEHGACELISEDAANDALGICFTLYPVKYDHPELELVWEGGAE